MWTIILDLNVCEKRFLKTALNFGISVLFTDCMLIHGKGTWCHYLELFFYVIRELRPFPIVKLVKQDIFIILKMSCFFLNCNIIINSFVAKKVVGRLAWVTLYGTFLTFNGFFSSDLLKLQQITTREQKSSISDFCEFCNVICIPHKLQWKPVAL